jgi:hypothetical protein
VARPAYDLLTKVHTLFRSQGGTVQAMLYDPSGPVNTDKMNMAYMHRHMPRLSGAHLRMPVPLSAGGLPPPAAY